MNYSQMIQTALILEEIFTKLSDVIILHEKSSQLREFIEFTWSYCRNLIVL